MLTTAVFRRLPSATPLLLALTLAGPGGAQSVLDEDTASAGAYQPGDILGIDDAALTPDGRWIVARDNTINTSARIYDYVTGALVTVITSGTVLGGSGVVQDAVEVTNTRAVVLGNRTMILDLVPNPPVLLVDHDTGYQPRDLAITPDFSIQFWAQPFVAAGDYEAFKELAAPSSFDFTRYGTDNGSTLSYDSNAEEYSVDPDGGGPAAAFSFANPDFRFRSLRTNLVARWEYAPGATLFLVWNHGRSGFDSDPTFNVFDEFDNLLGDDQLNTFLVKFTYRFAS